MLGSSFTSQQFLYWLAKMGLSYEEAADLLNVSVSRIEGYAYGLDKVPVQQVTACRLLLKLKTQRLNREKHLRNRSCLSWPPSSKDS